MLKLSPEQDAALKRAAKEKLLNFTQAIDPAYEPNWHHEIIAEVLERAVRKVEAGENARLMLFLPPRYGKSELATIKFPAWVLGQKPDWPIIVTSYAAELAVKFGMLTRDAMNSYNYQAIFSSALRKDQKAKGNWLIGGHRGGYKAAGVGGPITGSGFKIGIIDDPFKNQEEAESPVIREKVYGWYQSTFYTRQEGHNAIILIMTRWHTDDLAGRLLEEERLARKAGKVNYDQWEVVKFPAVAERVEVYRDPGDPLWPEKFDKTDLEVTRETSGPYVWAALYQQDPIPSKNQHFNKDWFKYYNPVNIEEMPLEYTTTVDPSGGDDGKENDEWVILTCGKAPASPFIYRIEETAAVMNAGEARDAIMHHQKKYRSEVFIEGVAYQHTLKYALEEEMEKRKQWFVVHELKKNTKVNKRLRILGLVGPYSAGHIEHLRRMDTEYERQLLHFPKGKHDDRIDAMASQLEAIENTDKATLTDQSPAEIDGLPMGSPLEGTATREELEGESGGLAKAAMRDILAYEAKNKLRK